MGIIFLKFLKWWISASAFILGGAFLQKVANTGDFPPVAVVVLSFGVVFWLSKSTYEAPKNIFIAGMIVLVVAGVLARLVIGDFVGYYLGGGYYLSWFLCTSAIGLPVMMYIFAKE